MKEANVISLRAEKEGYDPTAYRMEELKAFMESDYQICELERFCKLLTSDYNSYTTIAFRMHLLSNEKGKSKLSIYTRHGILYAAKEQR